MRSQCRIVWLILVRFYIDVVHRQLKTCFISLSDPSLFTCVISMCPRRSNKPTSDGVPYAADRYSDPGYAFSCGLFWHLFELKRIVQTGQKSH